MSRLGAIRGSFFGALIALVSGMESRNLMAVEPASTSLPGQKQLEWQALPALPDREGFAAMFAGVTGESLLAAGGANFPDQRPWEGGTKRWYDDIWLLEKPESLWRNVGKLPRPCAYGVSVSVPESETNKGGVICAGGGDATSHSSEVFRLSWDGKKIVSQSLPALPNPCAFMSGALVGNTFYIAGGIERPDATTCLATFWALDVTRPEARWQALPPCPGPERMLAVAGGLITQHNRPGTFYLFSGTRLQPDPQTGRAVREYLSDAWSYHPTSGWQQLRNLPRAAVAAPSPAPNIDAGRLLVISGDDGLNVNFKPETEHPGFPRNLLAYDTARDSWTDLGAVPFSRATAPTVEWHGRMVVPSGEARPGYRSPEVWATRMKPN